MTAVPVCLIVPFLLFLTQYKNLTDTVFYVSVYTGLAVIILFTLYLVFKQAMVPATIGIKKDGLEIVFSKKTIFNWTHRKYILFENIEYVSDDVDLNFNARKFFTLKVKDENGKIILTAPKKAPSEEMESFSLELSNAIEDFNSQFSGVKPRAIKKGSFYTGAFGKFFTLFSIAAVIVVTIIKIAKPSNVEWYRVIWVYVLAASWLINFYSVKKKQTTENNGE
jgi:hypothetical protein